MHCQWGEKPLPGDRCCGLLSEEARATAIGNMHKKFGKDRAWVLEISYQTVRQSDRQAGGFVWPDCAPSSERPQFGMPPVRNAPELRLQHDAAPPVQLQYPGERRAAAAMPLPESP